MRILWGVVEEIRGLLNNFSAVNVSLDEFFTRKLLKTPCQTCFSRDNREEKGLMSELYLRVTIR